ncbi:MULTISPECIES: MBL fold metallo-hydrolase [unclassified Kribbella]|uniref:MBL fold metallo-hydrolase n=1 Tax=unclassified Kribbella TaxID=2644121 RepID=UPI0033DB73F6
MIAIDAPPTLGNNILRAIDRVTRKPITHVVYSHHHSDHSGAMSICPKAHPGTRSGPPPSASSALELGGVPDGEARMLLSSAVRFVLDERVRDQIIAETRGNPLALLELPRGLTATQLAGGFGLLEAQALTGRIEESFVRRLAPLEDPTRRLLMLAAAEPVGDPRLLWRAAARLGIATAAAEGSEAQGTATPPRRRRCNEPLRCSAISRSRTCCGGGG